MKHERISREGKNAIIESVRNSGLPVDEALRRMGIPRSSYYSWTKIRIEYREGTRSGRVWNKLLPEEVERILCWAHLMPDLTPRDLSCWVTDHEQFSVSESSVYRVLKAEGLIKPALTDVAAAAKEYHRKTTRVNEMWATDFTYVKIVGWGWYYVGGVLDDFSRYLICFDVAQDMKGVTCGEIVQKAIEITGLNGIPVHERETSLLSDNGSGYISDVFNTYLRVQGVHHIFARRNHPQTNGKMERLNRTAKGRICQTVFRSPWELEAAVEEFIHWYNEVHYHEVIGNLHPADMYFGRGAGIIARR